MRHHRRDTRPDTGQPSLPRRLLVVVTMPPHPDPDPTAHPHPSVTHKSSVVVTLKDGQRLRPSPRSVHFRARGASPSLPAPRFVQQSRFGRCQARSDPTARAAPTLGHRARTGDLLYGVRCTLPTRAPLLSTGQRSRVTSVFADDRHIAVTVAWSIVQRITPPIPARIGAAERR